MSLAISEDHLHTLNLVPNLNTLVQRLFESLLHGVYVLRRDCVADDRVHELVLTLKHTTIAAQIRTRQQIVATPNVRPPGAPHSR